MGEGLKRPSPKLLKEQFMATQLTYEQLTVLESRFRISCRMLKQTGDYPEEQTDKEIINQLISMKFEAAKREGIF